MPQRKWSQICAGVLLPVAGVGVALVCSGADLFYLGGADCADVGCLRWVTPALAAGAAAEPRTKMWEKNGCGDGEACQSGEDSTAGKQTWHQRLDICAPGRNQTVLTNEIMLLVLFVDNENHTGIVNVTCVLGAWSLGKCLTGLLRPM